MPSSTKRGFFLAALGSGEELARIPLPNNALSTNLGFGRGADAASLYADSALAWRLWRIRTVRRGHYFE